MSDNQKVGQGALFKNDKQGVEKRPDYTGPATILGKKFFISAWLTTSRNGEKYMSLAFCREPRAKQFRRAVISADDTGSDIIRAG